MRYLTEPVDVAALTHERQLAGDEVHVIRARRTLDKSLAKFAAVLHFPDYFGGNLDALMDCLRDVDSVDGRPVVLIWDRTWKLEAEDPHAYQQILEVLSDLERERPDLRTIVIRRPDSGDAEVRQARENES